MTEVLSSSTPGSKQKATGLQVNAAVNYDQSKGSLVLELEFSNQSSGPISDFDLMINKNAFGVGPAGPCGPLGITYPAPFETSAVQTVPLKTDKKYADTKAPPKHPFTIQIALKSSLDVFYFTVPCSLHSLISRDPS